MSNELIDDLNYGSLKELALYLSLPPHESIARPSQKWLDEQEAGLRDLRDPQGVLLRPKPDSLNMMDYVTRGLMKVSVKQSLPFVPDAAVLCTAHKSLNPWRIRALFQLLASEVTDKFERMRRVMRNNSDLAKDPSFQELVCRITSIQALWMDRRFFEQLYKYPPVMMEKVESQCEACICAVVGGDARLLVDLRAHLHSRAGKATPVFLKVVDAWIDAFKQKVGDQTVHDLKVNSAVLAEDLRQIRHEIGVRRHQRREAYRQAGKSVPYSKAKHKDDSNVPLPPKSAWAPKSGNSSSTPSDTIASTRFGQHDPNTSYQRPMSPSSCIPETPSSTRTNPFDDEHIYDTHDHYETDEGDDDANVGNPAWTKQMNGLYERPGSDSNSVHPAFRISDAPSSTQVSETRTLARDTSQTTERSTSTTRDAPRRESTPSRSQRRRPAEPRPEPASSSRTQPAESETASSRPSSRSRPSSTPRREEQSRPSSRSRPSSTPRQEEQSRLSAVRIETLGGDLRPQPPPSTAPFSSSIPPSMAHRESRARSQLQELAAASGGSDDVHRQNNSSSSRNRPASSTDHHRSNTTTSRTNRPSSRASDAVSSPPSRPANNPVTREPKTAAATVNNRPSTAPAASRTRPQEDVSEAAATARDAWQTRFAALSLNDSGRREVSGNGRGRSNSSSSSSRAPTTRHNSSRVPPSTREPESTSSSSSRTASSTRTNGSRAPSTREPDHPRSSSRTAPSTAPSVSHHSTAGRSRRASTSSWTSSVYSEEEAGLQPVQSDLYRGVVDLMRGGRDVYDDDATTVASGSTRR